MSGSRRPPLVIILGPTAVGKTEISLQLAERLDGEIISADSRYIYRGMDIGTAKPTPQELERVSHHLIDTAKLDEVWSLAVYKEEAREAIRGIHGRGRLPILVGGTGQYIRAVTEEWEIPRVEPNLELRKKLEDWTKEIGADGLHQRLAVLDPEAAHSIDYRNLRRTVRALEVILTTGRSFSGQRERGSSPYRTLQIGLTRPRPELYERVDARIDQMLEAGLIDEVRSLLEQGFSAELPALSAIGYREVIAYLRGEISQEEAVVQIRRATRVFVRRQANWFKSTDPEIHWFQVNEGVIDRIEEHIQNWLRS